MCLACISAWGPKARLFCHAHAYTVGRVCQGHCLPCQLSVVDAVSLTSCRLGPLSYLSAVGLGAVFSVSNGWRLSLLVGGLRAIFPVSLVHKTTHYLSRSSLGVKCNLCMHVFLND